MKIEHIAVWVADLEKMREFYQTYFDASCGSKYVNTGKNYSSYFISFSGCCARIELMHRPDISDTEGKRGFCKGMAHLAMTVGKKEDVNRLTERLRADGYAVLSEPRTTGDGYYESAVADPEGNYIELLAE